MSEIKRPHCSYVYDGLVEDDLLEMSQGAYQCDNCLKHFETWISVSTKKAEEKEAKR